MVRLFFLLGTLTAGIAVAAGAFGAHGLKSFVSTGALENWNTAVRYQMYHAIALLVVAFSVEIWPSKIKLLSLGGWLFFSGIILFSGSLYALVLSKVNMLGMITPIGGILFVVGWLTLVIAVWNS
jgi:uncharacterized membrane protein YgdD (TMEM256/DUF423 family)